MRPARDGGFSLIEVLVAFAILSLSLPVILGVFSNGLRASARAAQYELATQLADSKLTELSAAPSLELADMAGTYAQRYEWQATVRQPEWWLPDPTITQAFTPNEITVRVSWSELGRERSVALTTLRLLAAP